MDNKLGSINSIKNIKCTNRNDNMQSLTMPDVSTKNYESKRRLIINTPFASKHTTNYGLIVYAIDTKSWLLIQPVHTIEFILFIRGIYRPTILPIYLGCITVKEAAIILSCLTDESFFREIYLTKLSLSIDGLDYALIRLHEAQIIVPVLLRNLNLSNNTVSWEFPKGRLQYNCDSGLSDKPESQEIHRETPLACVRRQFVTITGTDLPQALFISGDYIAEKIKTMNNRIIECRYWIYIVAKQFNISNTITNTDIIAKEWVDTEQCRHRNANNSLFQRVADIVSNIL